MINAVVFLMGVAGSGKTTVMTHLMKKPQFHYIQSYVTRVMRQGEVNGERYFFITKKEFEIGIQNNEFLEYAYVHDRDYYGTKKELIYQAWQNNKIALKELDVIGREKITTQQDIAATFLTIFLNIDDVTMTTRMLTRQPDIDSEELYDRLTSAEFERMKAHQLCHHIVDASKSIDQVLADVDAILQKHLFLGGGHEKQK